MAKKPGPKEAAMRNQREGGNTGTDPVEAVKKKLAELEARQEEERKKFLSEQTEPIRNRINELEDQRRQISGEIEDLWGTLAALEGKKAPARRGGGGTGGKRIRRTEEEKLKLAEAVFGVVNAKRGSRVAPADLNAATEGVPLPALVELWNQKNPDRQIHREGQKSTTRYYVGK